MPRKQETNRISPAGYNDMALKLVSSPTVCAGMMDCLLRRRFPQEFPCWNFRPKSGGNFLHILIDHYEEVSIDCVFCPVFGTHLHAF